MRSCPPSLHHAYLSGQGEQDAVKQLLGLLLVLGDVSVLMETIHLAHITRTHQCHSRVVMHAIKVDSFVHWQNNYALHTCSHWINTLRLYYLQNGKPVVLAHKL